MHRTTRKLSLTEDGLAFLARAAGSCVRPTDAAAELSERRGALVGPLRLSAPVTFGTCISARRSIRFWRGIPGIELTLDLDDRLSTPPRTATTP